MENPKKIVYLSKHFNLIYYENNKITSSASLFGGFDYGIGTKLW